VLIGSFLSLRVQTDKTLIYASFQVQLSAVKLSTFEPMRFYGLFKVANQRARKAIDDVHVILNKIHLSFQDLKKTPSGRPGQVDFPFGQVTFSPYLPHGQGPRQAVHRLNF